MRKKFSIPAASVYCLILLSGCFTQRIQKAATETLLKDSALAHAHVGISVYDPVAGKYIYNYQADKYFIPASNTKIFSCYASLRYLPDSLPGIRFRVEDSALYIFPTGDPTLLHRDFSTHPVADFLKSSGRKIFITAQDWNAEPFGMGWSWDDFNNYYMPERSPLPVYGNVIRWIQERTAEQNPDSMAFDQSLSIYSLPEVNWKVRFTTDLSKKSFFVQRRKDENLFQVTEGNEQKKEQEVPFITNGLHSAVELLSDTIRSIEILQDSILRSSLSTVYSQPRDTVVKKMMQRSDNFYAEQLLLMASDEVFGKMNTASIIDTVLNELSKTLTHRPQWVDGSGLSRHNLFTPKSFVEILAKMQGDFTQPKIQSLFPTPGIGTLGNYNKSDSGYIFAKTGSLSGVVALSGYLLTKKGKLLIFSCLVNNHRSIGPAIKARIQSFLSALRDD